MHKLFAFRKKNDFIIHQSISFENFIFSVKSLFQKNEKNLNWMLNGKKSSETGDVK